MTHPVADLLRSRRAGASEPGRREDPHRVALVLEGGGMRGVVSAAMAAALERLGLTRCFDLVVGSSAGALNGAAFLAGVAGPGAETYCGVLASRRFVNPARLLVGRPALDVNFVLDHANAELDGGRHERAVHSPIALHTVALDVDSARTREFTGMRTKDELWRVLLATTRMPWVGGRPVEIDGRRYVDGALTCPLPVGQAVAAGATHVLVLQTRPQGVARSAGRMGERLVERHLRGMNPALVPLWRGRVADYERQVADIAHRSNGGAGGEGPAVLGLRPPLGSPCVGQLERRPDVLRRAADDAQRIVERALG